MGHYLANRSVISHKIGLESLLKVGTNHLTIYNAKETLFCNAGEQTVMRFQCVKVCSHIKASISHPNCVVMEPNEIHL